MSPSAASPSSQFIAVMYEGKWPALAIIICLSALMRRTRQVTKPPAMRP